MRLLDVRVMFLNAFIFLGILCSSAQQPLSPALQAFTAQDYATYLTSLPTELAGTPGQPQPRFDRITCVAIALEKTKGWDAATGKQAAELLAKSPEGTAYLQVMRLLVGGDTRGVLRFVEVKRPEAVALLQAQKTLREHGFELAANVLGTLAPDMPGKRIIAWLSIPEEQRGPVDQIMDKLYQDNMNRRDLARAALELYLRPQPGMKVDPAACYKLARWFGKDTGIISDSTAQQLATFGKLAEAREMTLALAAANPTEMNTQIRALHFLWFQLRDDAGFRTLSQTALQQVPEPERREIRQELAEYLRWAKKTDELAVLEGSQDPLLAADTLLTEGKFPEATARYAQQFADRHAPLPVRQAAWSGLLDSDPAAALDGATGLLEEIAQAAPETRPALITWVGWQLWRTVERDIPNKIGVARLGVRMSYRPMREVPESEAKIAALIERLLALDTLACLKPDPARFNRSLRPAAVLLAALARQPEQAAELLKRPIKYQVMPPPGGWRIFDGSRAPDAEKPRAFTGPQEQEIAAIATETIEAITRCPQALDRTPPLAARLANFAVEKIKAAKASETFLVTMHTKCLAAITLQTVIALSPKPAAGQAAVPAELAKFAPVEAALREALALDTVAGQSVPTVIREGLQPAMLAASDPKLLDTLFALTTTALDRDSAVSKQPADVTALAEEVAKKLDTRKDVDLTAYAQQLRARYPKQ